MQPRQRRWVRVAAILLLLTAQVALMLHYGQSVDTCPRDPACLAADYDRYVGDVVRYGGPVVATDPPTIAVDYAPGQRLRLQLADLPVSVQRGDTVVVYGELQPNRVLAVDEAVTHPRLNRYYMYTVSFLTLVGVTVLGLRYWRFDRQAFVFRRRDR